MNTESVSVIIPAHNEERKMNRGSVSIIIPVYNCEEYIEKCIESVTAQQEIAIEILLIDDGSKDSSGTICDRCAEKDNRIKVFHIQNQGVSNARNIGIMHAKGEYIQFVDGDDCIKPKMTEILVRTMEASHADLVVCGYDRITKYIRRRDKLWDRPGLYNNKEYIIHSLQDPTGYYYGVVWNKLYQSKIIKQNQILFNNTMKLGEDFVFNLEVLKHVRNICVISERLYIYNYANTGTLSKYRENTLEVYKCEFEHRNKIFEYYKNCFIAFDLYKEFDKQIYGYWKNYYARTMYELKHGLPAFSEEDKKEWKNIILSNENIIKLSENLSKIDKLAAGYRIRLESISTILKKPIKKLSLLAKLGKYHLVNR